MPVSQKIEFTNTVGFGSKPHLIEKLHNSETSNWLFTAFYLNVDPKEIRS